MNHEQTWLKAFGDMPVECLGGLLAHFVRVFDHPDGLYRDFKQNLELYTEYFGLDNDEVGAVIDGSLHPPESILTHYNLELFIKEDKCNCCGAISQQYIYRLK